MELHLAILGFSVMRGVVCPVFHVVLGAGWPVEVLDEDAEVVVRAVSGVALGAKYVVVRLRKIRIAVLASRAKGVVVESGFADDSSSFEMWLG